MLRSHTSARVPAAFENSLVWSFGMRAFGRTRRIDLAEANITFIDNVCQTLSSKPALFCLCFKDDVMSDDGRRES